MKNRLLGLAALIGISAMALSGANAASVRYDLPGNCSTYATNYHEWNGSRLNLTCYLNTWYVDGTGHHVAYSPFSKDIWIHDDSGAFVGPLYFQ